jgi:hypothetical protein
MGGRRFWSVVMGAVSLGLFMLGVFAMVDVANTYGDAFGGGFGLLWVLIAVLASFFGAGAVAMWNPPRSDVMSKALFWIAGVAIVIFGLAFFFVAP